MTLSTSISKGLGFMVLLYISRVHGFFQIYYFFNQAQKCGIIQKQDGAQNGFMNNKIREIWFSSIIIQNFFWLPNDENGKLLNLKIEKKIVL